MTEMRTVLVSIGVETLCHALGLPPNTTIEQIFRREEDTRRRSFTFVIAGHGLPDRFRKEVDGYATEVQSIRELTHGS